MISYRIQHLPPIRRRPLGMRLLPPLHHIHRRPLDAQERLYLPHHRLQQPPRLRLHGRERPIVHVVELPRVRRIVRVEPLIPRMHDARPGGRAARKDARRVEGVAQREDVVHGHGTRRGPVAEEALHAAGAAHRAARVAAHGDVEPVVRGDACAGAGRGAAGGLVAVALKSLVIGGYVESGIRKQADSPSD